MQCGLVLALFILGFSLFSFASDPELRTCRVQIAMSNGEEIPSKLHFQLFSGTKRISEVGVPPTGNITLDRLTPGEYRIQTGGTGANFIAAGPLYVPADGVCDVAVNIVGRTDLTNVVEEEVDVEDLRVSHKVRGLFHEAFKQVERGELQKAKEAFLEVTRLAPKLARTYNVLGVICDQQGDAHGARQYFEKALEVNPRNRAALMNLAKLDLVERQFEPALTLLQRYRMGARDVADVHAMAAEAYLKLGRYNDAIREAKATHTLPHSNWASVHVFAAVAFEAIHEPEHAVTEYRHYIEECTAEPLRQRAAQRIRDLTAVASRQDSQIPMNSLVEH